MNANMRHAILERSWKCYVKRVIRNVEYAFQTICYNARRLACIRRTCTGDSSSNLDLYIYTITKQEKRKTENVMNSLCLIASIPYYKLENGKNTHLHGASNVFIIIKLHLFPSKFYDCKTPPSCISCIYTKWAISRLLIKGRSTIYDKWCKHLLDI